MSALAEPQAPTQKEATTPYFGVYTYQSGASPQCHIYAADSAGMPMTEGAATEVAAHLSSEAVSTMVLPLEDVPLEDVPLEAARAA